MARGHSPRSNERYVTSTSPSGPPSDQERRSDDRAVATDSWRSVGWRAGHGFGGGSTRS
jgi:hypothetical protein